MSDEGLRLDMSRQRRPAGRAYYQITEDLRRRFTELAETQTYRSIADEFERRVGYRPDPSSFSHIKNRAYGTSRIADDLARIFGWPRPPRVGVYDEAFSVGDRLLRELHERSPEAYQKVLEYAEMHLRTQRDIVTLRGTEDVTDAASELLNDENHSDGGTKTHARRTDTRMRSKRKR